MAIYTVKERNQALSYEVMAANAMIMNGGALTFWSETKMIRAINGSLWENVVLNREVGEKEGGF